VYLDDLNMKIYNLQIDRKSNLAKSHGLFNPLRSRVYWGP